jgi:hypothetical protein
LVCDNGFKVIWIGIWIGFRLMVKVIGMFNLSTGHGKMFFTDIKTPFPSEMAPKWLLLRKVVSNLSTRSKLPAADIVQL